MSLTNKVNRLVTALALASMLALSFGPVGFGSANAASPDKAGASKFTKHDRELLADHVAKGDATVTLLIAALPGANNVVLNGLARLGANVRTSDNALDYIRAIIPTGQADAASKLSGIQAVNLDELIPMDDPRPGAEGTGAGNVASPEDTPTPPGPGTPPLNPYLPTRDIGAPQFVAAHPTWDGRGVTIGIVDGGVDLLTPELQSAKLLDGTPTRKIIDWVNTNDPLSGQDPSWVNMERQVNVAGGTFVVDGVTYTNGPANGSYRFGIFAEDSINAGSEYDISCGADLNRDTICHQSFAVLWRTSDNKVWVDTNADHSFAGALPMTDYNINYDMDTFGVDNPATAIRESVPFSIHTDGKDKYVNIGVIGLAHGTHVAGIAAGKGFFGGAFNGAAPEARIISVRVCLFINSCTNSGIIDGMIFAAKQGGADVVNMSIGGLPALNDGNTARDILFNRLIDQTKTQLFFSAGNSGAGVNTVGDPAVTTNVMAVGAYVQHDTYFQNYGNDVPKADGMFYFSSRGPREDGGFKPDITAPGSAVSTIPKWQQNFPLIGPLPYGYDMYNGTSMAAPEATGGAALLISAAKQYGAQHKPDQLRQAIKSSARYLPYYGAHEQGAGLFNIGAAWDLLKTNIRTTEIVSDAPVNTVLSGFLAVPGRGPGIYEREGLPVGYSGTRTITFTRTSGGSRAVNYQLTWVGNDGTFSSATTLALALNTPTNLTVNIAPLTSGVHSANLYLDDPTTAGIDYMVMNTVVGAQEFNTANNFAVTMTGGTADRADRAAPRYFFYVPANTPALKLDFQILSGRMRQWPVDPWGLPVGSPGYTTGPANLSQTIANPKAGVWEVVLDASRAAVPTQSTFNLTAAVLGVDISPAGTWTLDPVTIGTTYNQSFSYTNRFGSFTGAAAGTALGSAFAARPTVAAGGAPQQFPITVPAGATSLNVKIGNASDPAADLDLYLFDCHTGSCVQRAASGGGTAEETVTVANPTAGTWVALVDPYAVPAGTTQYNYLDVYQKAGFGATGSNDVPAVHASGATWSATGSATAAGSPGAGRFLQGFIQVKSGTIVLGQTEVNMLNVTP